MADTMQFDLVAPERRLASVQAREVQIPGADGNLTAMPGHAPLITTLRPGVLRVTSSEGTAEYAVTGGFAEINATGMSVLAERAVPVAEMTQDILDQFVSEAAAARDNSSTEDLDLLAKRVADIAAMGGELGLAIRA
jgi:F-type H+-transporting ATPase subunit epsilon